MRKIVVAVFCLFLVQACSTTAHFTTRPDKGQITISKAGVSEVSPTVGEIGRTTFGKYTLKVQKEGFEPMYGVLPLHVSPAAIVLDALFFAPAAFFNVQGAFEYYEFDLEKRVIKYKNNKEDNWMEYTIPPAEANLAKKSYGR